MMNASIYDFILLLVTSKKQAGYSSWGGVCPAPTPYDEHETPVIGNIPFVWIARIWTRCGRRSTTPIIILGSPCWLCFCRRCKMMSRTGPLDSIKRATGDIWGRCIWGRRTGPWYMV